MFVITTLIIMPLKKEDFAAFRYFLSLFTVAKHVGELYGTHKKKKNKKN